MKCIILLYDIYGVFPFFPLDHTECLRIACDREHNSCHCSGSLKEVDETTKCMVD